MILSDQQIQEFQAAVWKHYRLHQRRMPWRDNPNPYWVLVSEVMLQQTQVERVLPKFNAFIQRLPTVGDLARAPLAEVLQLWSGLGYNRRAKALHQAAWQIVTQHGARIPASAGELRALPGIGPHTAGAIMVYAFRIPAVFIETNIRSVYFHHFFKGQDGVSDNELVPLIKQTLECDHPREWYWALMDYGTYLKRTMGNNIAMSRHYKKQSTFNGSRRQLRGQVLKSLLDGAKSADALLRLVRYDSRFKVVIGQLIREGFVVEVDGRFKLSDTRIEPRARE